MPIFIGIFSDVWLKSFMCKNAFFLRIFISFFFLNFFFAFYKRKFVYFNGLITLTIGTTVNDSLRNLQEKLYLKILIIIYNINKNYFAMPNVVFFTSVPLMIRNVTAAKSFTMYLACFLSFLVGFLVTTYNLSPWLANFNYLEWASFPRFLEDKSTEQILLDKEI